MISHWEQIRRGGGLDVRTYGLPEVSRKEKSTSASSIRLLLWYDSSSLLLIVNSARPPPRPPQSDSIFAQQLTNDHQQTMRTALLFLSFVAIHVVDGYTTSMLHQRSSHFVGRDVIAVSPPSSSSSSGGRHGGKNGGMNIEMKKGKANLPSHMRSQYKRSQEMEAYRKQMIDSQVRRRLGGIDLGTGMGMEIFFSFLALPPSY
jgi:hypothetical protein